MRVNLRQTAGTNQLLNLLGELRQIILTHGAALACLTHAGGNLRTVEGLGHAGTLNHRNGGGFNGRETASAGGALAAAANCGAIIGGAGIHYARVGVLAIGAVHSFLLGWAIAPEYTALKNIYTYSTVIYSGYTVCFG